MKRRSFIAGSLLAAASCEALHGAPAEAAPATVKGKSPAPVDRSILKLNPPKDILPMLQNMQMRAIKPVAHKPPVYQQEQLILLHFADIHNDVKNLRRVMEFANHYKPYLTDALLTGDIGRTR